MTTRLPLAPLDPSPDGARSLLRRELLRPEYHDQDLLGRLLAWLERTLERGLDAASRAPALSTFAAMLLLCLLALALAWLTSRAGRSSAAPIVGPVLTEERVSAAELRARAEAALSEGRHDDAVVDGFRALAVRQVEQGRLPDAPGTTAREAARELGAVVPALAPRVAEAATRFDLVLYGGRPATAEQATSVLALDDALVGVR